MRRATIERLTLKSDFFYISSLWTQWTLLVFREQKNSPPCRARILWEMLQWWKCQTPIVDWFSPLNDRPHILPYLRLEGLCSHYWLRAVETEDFIQGIAKALFQIFFNWRQWQNPWSRSALRFPWQRREEEGGEQICQEAIRTVNCCQDWLPNKYVLAIIKCAPLIIKPASLYTVRSLLFQMQVLLKI